MQLVLSRPLVIFNLEYLINKAHRYLQVGSLLHLIAFINYYVARYFFLKSALLWDQGISLPLILYIYLFLFFGSIPFFAELDAWSRWQNYKLFRDLIYQYGYRERFAKSLIHSRCQREAAYIAALDVGCTDQVARFYYQKGYRWYHLIPDFVFKCPRYLITRNFWNTTFFAKKYKVKYYPE
ncbi:hypothetical protein ACFLU5_02990 [Bacteroidota bacterium]